MKNQYLKKYDDLKTELFNDPESIRDALKAAIELLDDQTVVNFDALSSEFSRKLQVEVSCFISNQARAIIAKQEHEAGEFNIGLTDGD